MKDELFKEALRLLQDLADIQNGPPRVQDDGEWNQLMTDMQFHCQAEIEGGERCEAQCDHCKKYYNPLEKLCPHCNRYFDIPETFGSVFCCKACENGY